MKQSLNLMVVGVRVELDEEEFGLLDFWFMNRESRDPGLDMKKFERGLQIMIRLCATYREGFHKDGN
jgi:hypothetical protein